MVAVRIKGFGGMIPAIDDRSLPDNQAARSEDAWLYSGALIGLPSLFELHVCDAASTARVYRIPAVYSEPAVFDNSLWLEFEDEFTDVVRAPVVGDTFDRYYWASSNDEPRYTTRLRIEYNANPVSAVVTSTHGSDQINYVAHPFEIGDAITFTTTAADLPDPLAVATVYYVSASGIGADLFKLAPTLNDAINSTNTINLTDNGTGTHTVHSDTHDPWLLGIDPPAAIASINVTGGAAPTTTRSYVYTYVSAYGEEGPPSAAFLKTGNIDGSWDITLASPDAADLGGADRYLTLVRIYRTVTSTAGIATYFFVAEQNINDTTYSDTRTDTAVSAEAQLESTDWYSPPTDLEGWVLMPNGFLVGWREQELWFSEPYRPHAWNPNNTLALDYPVVGLGTTNQTLVIGTRGFPMTGTGVQPSAFTTSKLANFEPCIARGSIVSAPEGVYYASISGLVRVTPGKAENFTRNLITKDRWQTLTQVTKLRLARLGTALYGFGTASTGVFETTAFEVTAFVQEDVTGSLSGLMVDPINERVALNLLAADEETTSVFNDPWTGEVFLIRDNTVLWLDQINANPTYEPYLWRSKVFQFEKDMNLAVAKVYFEVPSTTPTQAAELGYISGDSPNTQIGDMVNDGGVAAAFDGETVQVQADSATLNTDEGYVGLTFDDPTAIHRVVTYGASDNGYVNVGEFWLGLYGKQGTAPADAEDGTLLGFVEGADDTTNPQTIISSDPDTLWDHAWVTVYGDGATQIRIAEAEFYANPNSTDQALRSNQYGLLRVYADGVLVATREIRTSGQLMRLPGGFKASFWQFEIEARVRVFSLQVASTVKELQSV